MIKLSLFSNERVVIEKYKCVKEISDDKILIDSYLIKGSFLKIKQMNSYMLEIKGIIYSIIIKDKNEDI